jgi:hypothetical protein
MISGTVRDVHGTPQMGALIELMRADEGTVATAISDDHGRYIMAMVTPGRYQLRATAAFFIPLLRNDVRLHAGVQSIVNLTMNNLFDADNWLPAQRRRADEPVDDWKWTLRSTASRPLLRLVDPEERTPISSSAEQPHRVSSQGRIMLTNGDGALGMAVCTRHWCWTEPWKTGTEPCCAPMWAMCRRADTLRSPRSH